MEKGSETKKKIGSLCDMAKRWNKKGEGPKAKQYNLAKTIRELHRSNKRNPNDMLVKLIDGYKKEFLELGGKIEDLKLK